jgi:uncharacterized protein (DUF697 family)
MALGRSLKLANLWRVVREVDLQAIRAQALSPFDLRIIAVSPEQGARLRALLTQRDPQSPHPWVRLSPTSDPFGATPPDAAILLTNDEHIDPGIDLAARGFRKSGIPTVVAHVSKSAPADDQAPPVPGFVTIQQVDEQGAEKIASTLLPLLPEDRRLTFARHAPAFRPALFDLLIEETARANAVYSLTTGLAEAVPILSAPLNLGDMIILTKNQLVMSYRLALAAGRNGEPRTMVTEILGVLGGGLLFRQIARQLVGLVPVVGILPKIAIAYGGTYAIGRAIVLWLTEGRTITGELVQTLAKDGFERGRAVARELMDRTRQGSDRPGRWERLRSQVHGLWRPSGTAK